MTRQAFWVGRREAGKKNIMLCYGKEINMKRRMRVITLTVILALVLSTAGAFACTGMYVGKDVSAEGTTVIARSEDQGSGSYNKMFLVQPRVTKAGRYFVDEGEDQNGFKVPLPKTTYKYTYVPDATDAGDGMYPASCTNEYGLAVIGTVSTGVKPEYEALDPVMETGTGLREAILPGLIACQCKTARGAVEKLGELVDTYGSEEWNTLFFADQKEAWIFEIYGGHTYAAMKMPTDKVAVFGNQIMIDWVDPQDTENFFFSKNLFETIDKAGGAVKDAQGRYNLVESIDTAERSEYSNMRTWRGHQVLAPSSVGTYSDKEFYELFYTPDQKVSVIDLMQLYGDRYEGTEFDMMKAENAARRAIGVTRQSDVHIIQVNENLPTDTCMLQWLSMGNAEHAVFVPAFSGITDTYDAYKVDLNQYSDKSMYYACKRICGIAEMDRAFLSQGVKDYNLLQEKIMLKNMQSEIAKISKKYKESKKAGRAYVTALANKNAKEQYLGTTNLYNNLLLTAVDNVNDRANNARKHTFVADTKMTQAANFYGYTVTKKTTKAGKVYTLKGADKTFKVTLGQTEYTVTENGKTTTAEMSKAPYVYGGYVYAPMDFLESL